MRVIVVDDFGSMRKVVCSALTNLGFSDIVEAKHGKEAWDKIIEVHNHTEQKIEMGIIDWTMPVMTGLQLLKKVRQDKRLDGFIFLMLTAEQNRENIVAAMRSGVDEYVIKPFSAGTLQGRLLNLAKKKLGEIEKEIDEYFKSLAADVNQDGAGGDKARVAAYKRKILKAGEITPWSHLGPLALGKLSLRAGEIDKAAVQFRKVISLEFGVTEAHKLLSQTLRIMGKIPDSIKELRIAVEADPESDELRQKLGSAYLHAGNYDLAIEQLMLALQLLGEKNTELVAKTLNLLGRAKMKKGEKEHNESLMQEAIAYMKQAVKLYPGLISAHYDLIMAYKKTGQTKEALAIYEFLKSIVPIDAEGWIALGKAYEEQSEHAKAQWAFDNAENMADGRYLLYEEMGAFLFNREMYDEALIYLDKATDCNPSEIYPYNLKGIIYRRKGLYAKSVKEYLFATKLDSDDANLFFNLGVAYFKSGQKGRSVSPFLKAKELNPNIVELDGYLKRLGADSKVQRRAT